MISYNLAVIIQKLLVHPQNTNISFFINKTSNTSLQTQNFIGQILFTLTNIKKVNKVKKLMSLFRNKILDLTKLIIIYKTLKAVKYTIANKIILNYTNTELLAANMQNKQQTQYTHLQFNS